MPTVAFCHLAMNQLRQFILLVLHFVPQQNKL
jgi:hypothetical protein